MTHSVMAAPLGPEFDAFLFASVGEERNGGLLSVLSALARSDLDPWREAAELAYMPKEAASRRLTSLISALPDVPTTELAPETIADRLIKLLPRRDHSSVASREKLLRTDPMPTSSMIAHMIMINLLVMAGMLCAQWAVASLQPQRVGVVHAAASGAAIPQTPQAGKFN